MLCFVKWFSDTHQKNSLHVHYDFAMYKPFDYHAELNITSVLNLILSILHI